MRGSPVDGSSIEPTVYVKPTVEAPMESQPVTAGSKVDSEPGQSEIVRVAVRF